MLAGHRRDDQRVELFREHLLDRAPAAIHGFSHAAGAFHVVAPDDDALDLRMRGDRRGAKCTHSARADYANVHRGNDYIPVVGR